MLEAADSKHGCEINASVNVNEQIIQEEDPGRIKKPDSVFDSFSLSKNQSMTDHQNSHDILTCDIDGNSVQTMSCVITNRCCHNGDDPKCLDVSERLKINITNFKKNDFHITLSNIASAAIAKSGQPDTENIHELSKETEIIQRLPENEKIADRESPTQEEVIMPDKKLKDQKKLFSELHSDAFINEQMNDDIDSENSDNLMYNAVNNLENIDNLSTKQDQTMMKTRLIASPTVVKFDADENKSIEVK